MTQWEIDDVVGTYWGFFNELEMGHRNNSIYVLHKAAKFLGYIPKTLDIDKTKLHGKFYAHRIINGYPLSKIARDIRLDKSTIARFEQGKAIKEASLSKILNYVEAFI